MSAFEAITTRQAWYANEALDKYDAAMVDTDGQLAKADGTGLFAGIVEYGAAAGEMATVVRGIYPGILSENATKGARLTIDSANPGKFKIAGSNDKTYGALLLDADAGDLAGIMILEAGAIGYDTTVNIVTLTTSGDVAGAYVAGTTTLALASATDGSAVFYRWGTTGQWIAYTAPVATTGKTGAQTLQAYATKSGMADSAISEFTLFQAVAAVPVFNPLTDTDYTAETSVTLAAANCTIKYKVADAAEWSTYSEAIAATAWTADEVTIQAYSVRTGYADSAIVTATYAKTVG